MQIRPIRHLGAVLCAATVLLTACKTPPEAETPLLVFPTPPERPRIQFLTWFSGSQQVVAQAGNFARYILGEEPAAQRNMNKPYGVAARNGVVYVCDTKDLCVCKLDFVQRTYSILGARGSGRLRKPINIVIDPLDYKFVVDPFRKQVVVFSPNDEYVTAFDVPTPCHPVDVAFWENELYVLDNDETCQIVVLSRTTGEELRTFGGPGGEPGQFKIPSSLCIDSDGYLYVSDTHNWRIQKLTRYGEVIWVKGMPGYGLGQFGRPRGIRAAPNGVIYLADGATEIVQMFNTDGETLMHFAGPGNMPGALVLPSSLAVDATSLPYFKQFIHQDFDAEYLLFVASQYGERLINVYAFGSFPEGYAFSELQIAEIPKPPLEAGIGPVPQPPVTDEVPLDEVAPDETAPDAAPAEEPPADESLPDEPPPAVDKEE